MMWSEQKIHQDLQTSQNPAEFSSEKKHVWKKKTKNTSAHVNSCMENITNAVFCVEPNQSGGVVVSGGTPGGISLPESLSSLESIWTSAIIIYSLMHFEREQMNGIQAVFLLSVQGSSQRG